MCIRDRPSRRQGRLTIQAVAGDEDSAERMRSLASVRRAREREKEKRKGGGAGELARTAREVVIPDAITVADLGQRMAVRGVDIINRKVQRDTPTLDDFLPILAARPPHRVAGAAIYLTADPTHTPGALLHNLKHNKVLHQQNVILNVETLETPRVPEADRVRVEPINGDFQRVIIKYG